MLTAADSFWAQQYMARTPVPTDSSIACYFRRNVGSVVDLCQFGKRDDSGNEIVTYPVMGLMAPGVRTKPQTF